MLYKISEDNNARYVLGRPNNNTLVVFGVNPSTATDLVFDRTITKVVGFAERYGFNGWLMLNVYPQRATDPKLLHEMVNTDYHAENLLQINSVLQSLTKAVFLAAWGNLITQRPYLVTCLHDIFNLSDSFSWKCIGLPTKAGHPKHPSRISYDNPLLPFDPNAYILNLLTHVSG